MANKLTLQAKVRTRAPKVVRREKAIPGVLYGHGIDAQSIEFDEVAFLRVYRAAGETSLVQLDLGDGEEHNVIVRDLQRHPVRDNVLHVDLYQVRLDEKISAHVPLDFTGVAPAVKDLGGVFVHPISELEVEAFPQNIPHNIQVDISSLDSFDKVIHVSDITAPEGVEVLHEADEVVALVQAPKSQEEIDAELAAEVTEDVEGVEGVADKPEEPAEGSEEGSAEAKE